MAPWMPPGPEPEPEPALRGDPLPRRRRTSLAEEYEALLLPPAPETFLPDVDQPAEGVPDRDDDEPDAPVDLAPIPPDLAPAPPDLAPAPPDLAPAPPDLAPAPPDLAPAPRDEEVAAPVTPAEPSRRPASAFEPPRPASAFEPPRRPASAFEPPRPPYRQAPALERPRRPASAFGTASPDAPVLDEPAPTPAPERPSWPRESGPADPGMAAWIPLPDAGPAATPGPGFNGAPAYLAPDTSAAAQVVDAIKVYGTGETAVRALDGITVAFETGRFTAIMGPSGSGKSTLMHCLAGLDRLTSGRVLIGTSDLSTLNDKALTRLRRDRVGFIFQSYNLVPTLTALENITLPLDLAGLHPDQAWLHDVLHTLRIEDRLGHKPDELSGGQQQRVAVARALATRPQIIFADEPTGNLDSRAAAEVLGILRDSVAGLGQTVVMVTHDPIAAGYADLAVFLRDGRLVDEMADPTAERVLDQMKTLGG